MVLWFLYYLQHSVLRTVLIRETLYCHFTWLFGLRYELEGPKREGELKFDVRHPFVINVGYLFYSEKSTEQHRISLDASK